MGGGGDKDGDCLLPLLFPPSVDGDVFRANDGEFPTTENECLTLGFCCGIS